MNWYEHHIGDWLRKTVELTAAEEGIYLRLCHWCYSHEAPLPAPLAEVRMIARVKTAKDRKALQLILDRYFELQTDGWHNARVDKLLKRYIQNEIVREPKRDAARARKQKSREKMQFMFRQLAAAGVSTSLGMSGHQLEQLCAQHGIKVVVSEPVTTLVTRDGDVTERVNPITNNQGSKEPDVTAVVTVEPTAAGKACRAMRVSGGGMTVNPQSPDLLDLLAKGVTAQELALCAAEAAARKKGFAYALGIAKSRLSERAYGPGRASDARQSRDEALVKAWAPTLANKSILDDPGASLVTTKP